MCGLITAPGSPGESSISVSAAKVVPEPASVPIAAKAPALRKARLFTCVSLPGDVSRETKDGFQFRLPLPDPVPSQQRKLLQLRLTFRRKTVAELICIFNARTCR